MQDVRQVLQPEGQPAGARAHPHGREAVPVRLVLAPLHHLLAAPPALQAPRARPAPRLRALRQTVRSLSHFIFLVGLLGSHASTFSHFIFLLRLSSSTVFYFLLLSPISSFCRDCWVAPLLLLSFSIPTSSFCLGSWVAPLLPLFPTILLFIFLYLFWVAI